VWGPFGGKIINKSNPYRKGKKENKNNGGGGRDREGKKRKLGEEKNFHRTTRESRWVN